MNHPTILLLGANGQVGFELQRALQPLGHVHARDRASAPLDDLPRLLALLSELKPQIVVNAAAYTAVDKAETDTATAAAINTTAPAALAAWCAANRALLVHYSTDYVFDGSGSHARTEDAPTGPLSVYGSTKLAGEQAIQAAGCAHLVFRTSWVYAARGGNFAKTMLRLATEREALSVVADQHGVPTGADLIADVTAQALAQCMTQCRAQPRLAAGQQAQNTSDLAQNSEKTDKYANCPTATALVCYTFDSDLPQGGIYNLCPQGETTWHAYAVHVIEAARAAAVPGRAPIKVAAGAIQGIPSSAYPTPAKRPHNSRLNTQKLQTTFGLHLPHWQTGVDRWLAQTLTA
jgi:dTDP-4-dehydrorhamnose reductase